MQSKFVRRNCIRIKSGVITIQLVVLAVSARQVPYFRMLNGAG